VAFFFDSSAIVKRYVQETGTPWVRRLTRRGKPEPIYLARITAVEVTSAVARRKGTGTGRLSPARIRNILARFRSHLRTKGVRTKGTFVNMDEICTIWIRGANAPMTEPEAASIRESIRRDRPLGTESCVRRPTNWGWSRASVTRDGSEPSELK
jgi:hypothetical protein